MKWAAWVSLCLTAPWVTSVIWSGQCSRVISMPMKPERDSTCGCPFACREKVFNRLDKYYWPPQVLGMTFQAGVIHCRGRACLPSFGHFLYWRSFTIRWVTTCFVSGWSCRGEHLTFTSLPLKAMHTHTEEETLLQMQTFPRVIYLHFGKP